jgi:hypothetical protein
MTHNDKPGPTMEKHDVNNIPFVVFRIQERTMSDSENIIQTLRVCNQSRKYNSITESM